MGLRTRCLISAFLASCTELVLPFVTNRSFLVQQTFPVSPFSTLAEKPAFMHFGSFFSKDSHGMEAFRKRHHEQHPGELEVQRKRNVPEQVSEALPHIVDDEMPQQHSDFFAGLEYFAIATMDSEGRPWPTILSAKRGTFIKAVSTTELQVKCLMSSEDPFVQSLVHHNANPDGSLLWAGLGIDFSNRRRNKVAGVILDAKVEPIDASSSNVELRLYTNENMGNCPKYITVRELVHKQRNPHRASSAGLRSSDRVELDDAALDIVARASTLFLATKHIDNKSPTVSDAGLNHRGGPPGFVRSYSRDGQSFLVLPDYSGNRFYQSLGNVQSDRVAGLVFPDFEAGALLHVTGVAENLFDADAQALLPRVSLLTRIRVTGFAVVEAALHLELRSPEQFSPYNPPIRFLASELEAMGKSAYAPSADADQPSRALLVENRRISSSVSTFTFQLDKPLKKHLPGGYVILDLSTAIDVPYMHMNQAAPQLVNDDLVRTWTVSAVDDAAGTVSCTIKNLSGGTVSPLLHSVKNPRAVQLSLKVVGNGGEFSCFASGAVPKKMLWVAGGIGITPFLAMVEGLRRHAAAADIVFLFACRGDDLDLLRELGDLPKSVRLRGTVFHSGTQREAEGSGGVPASAGEWSVRRRRVEGGDVAGISDLAEREAYVCGPAALEAEAARWLGEAGLTSARIHTEKFSF